MLPEESNIAYKRQGKLDESVYYHDARDREVRENREAMDDQPRNKKKDQPNSETDFFGLFNCCRNVPVEP